MSPPWSTPGLYAGRCPHLTPGLYAGRCPHLDLHQVYMPGDVPTLIYTRFICREMSPPWSTPGLYAGRCPHLDLHQVYMLGDVPTLIYTRFICREMSPPWSTPGLYAGRCPHHGLHQVYMVYSCWEMSPPWSTPGLYGILMLGDVPTMVYTRVSSSINILMLSIFVPVPRPLHLYIMGLMTRLWAAGRSVTLHQWTAARPLKGLSHFINNLNLMINHDMNQKTLDIFVGIIFVNFAEYLSSHIFCDVYFSQWHWFCLIGSY